MMELWLILLPTPMMFPPTTSVDPSEPAIGCGVDIWSLLAASVPCWGFAPLPGPMPGVFAPGPVVELPKEELPKDEFPKEEFPKEEFPKDELPKEELPKVELLPCSAPPD